MGLRINNNLASLNAALNLGRANNLLSKSLGRLSTGLKINSASDGPADLIISEKMRSQIRSIAQATENTQAAMSMLNTAEGALTEVNALLIKMKGLALKAVQSGTQDVDEIAASQAEIDSAIESINSIARNTSFGSKFLLDGSLDIATSEVNAAEIQASIEKANFAGPEKRIEIEVEKVAVKASTTFNLNASGSLDNTQTLKVTGNRGSSTITFAGGANGDAIASEINAQTSQTGVTATYNKPKSQINLESVEFGKSAFAQLEDADGSSDLLKGIVKEHKSAASLLLSNQFVLTAKNPGAEGNNIQFKYEKNSISAAPSISATPSGGVTYITLTLQDTYATRFGASATTADRQIATSLADVKQMIENNATLKDLVAFTLVEGASLNDKVTVDNSKEGKFVAFKGGASGDVAKNALAVLKGTYTDVAGISQTGYLNIAAQNAGADGNNLTVGFYFAGGTAANLALDEKGVAITSVAAGAGYFGGTAFSHFVDGNVLLIQKTASFEKIYKSIQSDAKASALFNVTYTEGANLGVVSTGQDGTRTIHQLTGGSGLSGGKKAEAVADIVLAAGDDGETGVRFVAKKAGAAGNGVEVILRNFGSTSGAVGGSVNVVGNKVFVNVSTVGTNSVRFSTGRVLSTGTAAVRVNIAAVKGGTFANRYNFRFFSDAAGIGLDYDASKRMISVSFNGGTTTYGDLKSAFNSSTLLIDETGLALKDVFVLSGNATALSVITQTISAGYRVGLSVVTTLGVDGVVGTTAKQLIQLIRGNAAARELVDVSYFSEGLKTTGAVSSLGHILSNVALRTLSSSNFQDSVHAFGDFRFVLSGGFDGEVSTTAVKGFGVDGNIKVNGVDTSADSLKFTFDNGDVRGNITLNESLNKVGARTAFVISNKGAFFQLGQKAQLSYQTGIALKDISAASLGAGQYLNSQFDPTRVSSQSNQRKISGSLDKVTSGGSFDLVNDATTALNIIDAAIRDVSRLRGGIGAFISNTLESNINSLGVAFENLTAAESRIRDVDFAMETAEFTRAQILVQAGTSVAAQANIATQSALQLLG